ncbi:MAG: hypothetical protein ACO24H_03355 [Polynucleobacter sp.]
MSCETTVLTGTSGAFYYKPAGTESCLLATDFPATGSNIQVGVYQGYRVGDQVTLAYPVGATVTGAIPAGDYYVLTYDAPTGVMTISATDGGAAETATAQPSGFGGQRASLNYSVFAILGQVRDWSFEITRNEIDVTTIGQGTGQYAPFRKFVTGYADGTGTATIYTTEDDTSLANRMIEDVIQRKQLGACVKLYIDQVFSGGVVSDTLSRFIQSPIVLTSASINVNPDDAQSVTINFRPSGSPVFDLSRTA